MLSRPSGCAAVVTLLAIMLSICVISLSSWTLLDCIQKQKPKGGLWGGARNEKTSA